MHSTIQLVTSLTDLITGPNYVQTLYSSLAWLCCIYVGGGQANTDELSTSRRAVPGPSPPKGYEPPEGPPAATTGSKNMAILHIFFLWIKSLRIYASKYIVHVAGSWSTPF